MRAILLILLIVAGFSRLHAQTQRLFSSDHDISSSMVNHVLEDSHGMIWVATEDGLNRYDGAKFTIYRNIPGDSTSLSHNLVRAIFEDRDGNLLVGTFNGMQIYDREHDCFSPRILTNGVPDFTGSVSSFFQRKNGEIWVVAITPAVIDSIRDGKAFTRPVHKGEERLAKSHRGLEDKHGNIFMLQSEDGICRIDSKGKVHTLLGRPGDPVMESITEDKDGNVYLGSSNKGLFRYDAVADKVIPLNDPNASYFLIKHIYADDDGSLYLATDGGGLKKYTPSDGKTSTVVEGMWDFDPRSSKTHSVIKDRNGNLWLGIFQRGVKVISEKNFHFKYLGKKSPVFDLIGSYCITAIKRDSSGRLWVGTDNDGIYALSPDHTSSRHYDGGNIPHIITSVFEDRQGRIWAGSFRQGAGVIDPATGSFRDVPIVSQNGKKVTRVYDFAQDNKGYIWIASMGFGLFRHDPATGSTIQFNVPGSRIDSWVCALHYSPARDILYLGTYNGFDIISGVTTKPKHTHLADGKIIFSIREDHKGTIWASSSDGIIKMNHGDPEMKIYSMSDGLPSNNVYSLETDGDVVWIATNFGLSRFDTKSNSFSNFYTDDGLQGNEFYKNASFADKSGVLYFGGLNGITFFRPDALNDVRADLSVRVTDFYIRGKGVRAGMKSGSRDIISVPVYEAEEFHLSYADNSFSVEFAARELERAQNMQYLYSFDDEKWSSLPIGSHRVNFSDVAPGRHTIRLKAIEKGVESEEKRIFVDIAPPWYLSIWAKILYSLLIAVAICGSFVMAHFRIKKRNEILEQEYVKQMNEAKLQFFFNISHEIRTPMSLVIGPLEKLMKIDQDSDRNQSYRLIFRNAKRVLRLINELLDVRKIDRGQMRLNYTRTEIVPFIEDICYTFSEAMAAKNISFSFCHEGCDSLKAWIDLSNFDKVIVNILSNALKYTPNGGKIVINLSREPETDEMIISVTDSGQGVPDKEKEKIFNRFYQAEGHVVSGSGLGLHLTRQLVNLHGGNISVSDNPEGKGTRFTVTVPIEKPENASVAPPRPESEETATEPENTTSRIARKVYLPDVEEQADSKSSAAKKGTVMIVEDDQEIRSYIAAELSANYKVVEFEDGRQALDNIFKVMPQIVISDVMMPGLDGYSLTRKIKQNVNLNHIPVVLLTAKTSEDDNLEGLKAGADAYIAKPFNIFILMSTVDNLVSTRANLRNIYTGSQSQEENLEDMEAVSTNDKLMERIMKVVNANMSNPDLTIETFASEVGMSRVHLHRKLKELTNQSPRDFLRNMRLQQASKLLSQNDIPVSEVAYMTGFKSANHFSIVFKELYGVSPSAYAEQQKQESGE